MEHKLIFMVPIKKLMNKIKLSTKFFIAGLMIILGYSLNAYYPISVLSSANSVMNSSLESEKEAMTAGQSENSAASKNSALVSGSVNLILLILTLYWLGGIFQSLKESLALLSAELKNNHSDESGSLKLALIADDFGIYINDLAQMKHDFFAVVNQIKSVSTTVNSSSMEIASANNTLSERTQEQASCLVETSASLNNLTETIKMNAESAKNAADLSMDATAITQRGGDAVNQVIIIMGEINSSSKKIQEITSVIDGIAFQTNLLALNASVEAARAGEQGKGFAVVASEVRNLAQRSADAAKQIKSLIGDSMAKVASGDAQVKVTNETMQDIVKSIASVNEIIGKISIASNEQSMSIEQINIVIAQLEGNTQKNAAQVEEVAASAELLKEQSSKLVEVVRQFDAGEIEDVADKSKNTKPSQIINIHQKTKVASSNPPLKKTVDRSKKETKQEQVITEPILSPTKNTDKKTSTLDDEHAWQEF